MATLSFEIELELSGSYVPYSPATGPTYDCGGTPPEGDYVEDLDVTDAGVLHLVRPAVHERGSHARIWKRTSFLTGVDLSNPEVRKLLDNLLHIVRDDAESAVKDDEDRQAA
jgi:hypothetical protein